MAIERSSPGVPVSHPGPVGSMSLVERDAAAD